VRREAPGLPPPALEALARAERRHLALLSAWTRLDAAARSTCPAPTRGRAARPAHGEVPAVDDPGITSGGGFGAPSADPAAPAAAGPAGRPDIAQIRHDYRVESEPGGADRSFQRAFES
jgi:hypothetical protein